MSVPQGSIRGKLMFSIYVIDHPIYLTSGQAIMFANDPNLFFNNVSNTELFKKANEELHRVDSWIIANKLTLNIEKT